MALRRGLLVTPSVRSGATLVDGPARGRSGRILQRNVYGWFERMERGVYRLTQAGEAALRRWREGGADGFADQGGSPATPVFAGAGGKVGGGRPWPAKTQGQGAPHGGTARPGGHAAALGLPASVVASMSRK